MKYRVALFIIMLCITACNEQSATYTLYRNSPLEQDPSSPDYMRVHIASFNTLEGEEYNRANCESAKELFQNQTGVLSKFWCEKGTYKK
jgi:hypothetical protein